MRKIFFIIVLIIPLSIDSFSQKIIASKKSKELIENKYNKIIAKYNEIDDGISIQLTNTSKDTLFLFCSYFDSTALFSRQIHRINNMKNTYTLSFLPIIQYLYTTKSHLIKVSLIDHIITNRYLFEFVALSPNYTFILDIKYSNLFRYLNEPNNLTRDISIRKLKRAKFYNFKYLEMKNQNHKYDFFIEFAIFKEVSFLTQPLNDLNDNELFRKKARSYKRIRLLVEKASYNHPIIKFSTK